MCLTRLWASHPCPHPQRVLMASDCAHVCAVLQPMGLTKIINLPPEGTIVFCCDFSLWPRQMMSLHICESLQGWRWRSKEGSHPLPVGWHLALTSVRPTRTSRPQPPPAKFYSHGKPQWVTTHKLKIIFKGFCDLFSFFKPALPLYFSHSLTKNPGGVCNHLDTMQKAKEYSSCFCSYLMISLEINSILKYIFSVKTKPGLATHLYNLEAIKTAIQTIRVTSFYTKMPRQSKETIA